MSMSMHMSMTHGEFTWILFTCMGGLEHAGRPSGAHQARIGGTLGALRVCVGDILGASTHVGHVGDTSRTHWGHMGDTSGTHQGHIGDTSWTHRGHIGDTLGTHQGHIRDTFGIGGPESLGPPWSGTHRILLGMPF